MMTMVDRENAPLTVLVVHAHPDDECLGTGGLLARYSAEGIRTVLVTATLGEEGEIHDPELNEEEARPQLGAIREQELRRAVEILGISKLEILGYRDSGMAGTPANERPDNFHNADFDEALGRLVKLVRHYRPQVLITYNEDGGYGHPDHLQCHKLTAAAFDAAADPARFPEAGEAWAASKFYATAWSRENWRKMRAELKARGIEWPGRRRNEDQEETAAQQEQQEEEEEWGQPEESITAFIAADGYWQVVRDALLQHRTQPLNFFRNLPEDLIERSRSMDYFVILRSRVPVERPETDLFAGIRAAEPVAVG